MAVASLFLLLLAASLSYGANTPELYDTIVVGLGSAGVTAATTLARAGKKVLGLEAQDRIGGRVYTYPVGDGIVELGAEWIHGTESSRVYEAAIMNNVTLLTQGLVLKMYRSDGTEADATFISELLEFVGNIAEDRPEQPESLGQYSTRKIMEYLSENNPAILEYNDTITQILEFIDTQMSTLEGSTSWNDATSGGPFEDLKGNQQTSWHRHGYITFFDIMMNNYRNGPGLPKLKIKLNTEVTQIKWPQNPNEKVVVTCKDNAVYMANNVIVTVSLGVLKDRYPTLFSPPLPEDKATVIENMSMGVLNKIVLIYDEQWWSTDKNVMFGFLWQEEDKKNVVPEDRWTRKIMGPTSSMGNNNTITLWMTGDPARMMELYSEEWLKRKCMELLKRFMGLNNNIPEPTGILRTKWFSNPYTRGSYSYDSVLYPLYPNARQTLATPLTDSASRPRVLFAGEATNHLHFATVHGASESGYREAMRLLQGPVNL